MNDMCKTCACLKMTCNGTNETVWTGCVYKVNKQILGSFIWETGSINDNIRKILENKGTYYINNFNGNIIVKNKKVRYEIDKNNNYTVFI